MAKTHPVQFRAQPIDGTDVDFRPASCWDAADPAATITQNIKGQLRREMVRDFISGDAPAILGEIDDELLRDEGKRGDDYEEEQEEEGQEEEDDA